MSSDLQQPQGSWIAPKKFLLKNVCLNLRIPYSLSAFPVLLTIFFLNKFIYLFMAVLGLRCYPRAFSSCGERGLLFIAVHRLLIAVASLVVEHGL